MEKNAKSRDRNNEIIAFFYIIFGHRIHSGMSPDEARKEAYDAVTLRYGIGKGRLLNIISDKRHSRNVNSSRMKQNALSLISDLTAVNSSLEETRIKNEKLMDLLKECVDEI